MSDRMNAVHTPTAHDNDQRLTALLKSCVFFVTFESPDVCTNGSRRDVTKYIFFSWKIAFLQRAISRSAKTRHVRNRTSIAQNLVSVQLNPNFYLRFELCQFLHTFWPVLLGVSPTMKFRKCNHWNVPTKGNFRLHKSTNFVHVKVKKPVHAMSAQIFLVNSALKTANVRQIAQSTLLFCQPSLFVKMLLVGVFVKMLLAIGLQNPSNSMAATSNQSVFISYSYCKDHEQPSYRTAATARKMTFTKKFTRREKVQNTSSEITTLACDATYSLPYKQVAKPVLN